MAERSDTNKVNQTTVTPVAKAKEKKKFTFPKVNFPADFSSKLLLPMSIVFLAICISSSLIISSLILSKSIKDAGLSTSNSSNTNSSASNTTATPTATPIPLSMDQIKALFTGDYIKFGDVNKKVLFVEFSDPSCPYCHIAGGKDPELNKQAGDTFKLTGDGGNYVAPVEEMRKLVNNGKASFVWIYTNGHGNGEMGTKALYCANEKGKFWEVHDLLMNNAGYNLLNNDVKNDKTKSQTLADFLKSAMDPNDMKTCIDSGKYDGRIASDMNLYNSLTASYSDRRGTPTFLVNATPYFGAYSYTEMKSVVDSALQ